MKMLSFSINDCFFRFQRMSFRLSSVPNILARITNKVLGDFPKNRIIVIFDDILVHSKTVKEHLQTIDKVITALGNA